MTVQPLVFETKQRIRFREIDPNGHLNMANYLIHYTDHRFEGMRRYLGLDYKAIAALPVAFHIRRDEGEQLLSSATMQVVCIDKATGRPCAWPAPILKGLFL